MPKSRIEKATTNVIVWGFFGVIAVVVLAVSAGFIGIVVFGIRQLLG